VSGPLLSVRDLRTWFFTDQGVARAVDGVSFDVHEGETLGIVGESGCGKSVSVLSVMRLIPQPPGKIVGGEVTFDGENLLKLSDDGIRRVRGNEIAMIFQEPLTSLSPVHTVGSQIAEAVELHQCCSKEDARKRAIKMLEAVGIALPEQRFDEYPHQFSGGMRQRAMIAMALACNPQIIIADEPTTALDVMIQAQILDLLANLQAKMGLAVLFVTHDLGVVAEMCDTVLVMYGGIIAEYADVDTIFNEPRHPYTQELLKAFPDLSRPGAVLTSIPGAPPRLDALPPGCRFAPRCPEVMDICHVLQPAQHDLGDGHIASCHLVDPAGIPGVPSSVEREETGV